MEQGKIRSFVAVGLSDELRKACGALRTTLASSDRAVRWVRPEGIHLTLKFLGDVDGEAIGPLCEGLGAIASGFSPFELRIRRVGTFGSRRQPRVLWVGVDDPSGSLHALQARVEEVLEGLGFPRERRRWSPHLTLARIRGPLRDATWLDLVQSQAEVEVGDLHVMGFALLKSDLQPGGAVYTALGRFSLGS